MSEDNDSMEEFISSKVSFKQPIINGRLDKVTSHLFTLNYLPKLVKDGMIQCNLCKKQGIVTMLPYTVTSSAKKTRNGSTKEAVHHIAQCHPEAYKVYLRTKNAKKATTKAMHPLVDDYGSGVSLAVLLDMILSETPMSSMVNSYKVAAYQSLGFTVSNDSSIVTRSLRYHAARSRSYILTCLKGHRVNIFIGSIISEENYTVFYFLLLKDDFVHFLGSLKITNSTQQINPTLLNFTNTLIAELFSWEIYVISFISANLEACIFVADNLNLPHVTTTDHFLSETVNTQIPNKLISKISDRIGVTFDSSYLKASNLDSLAIKIDMLLQKQIFLEKEELDVLKRCSITLEEVREVLISSHISNNLLNLWRFSSRIICSEILDLGFKLSFNSLLESTANRDHLLDIFVFLSPCEPSIKLMSDFKKEHSRFFTAKYLSEPIKKLMQCYNLHVDDNIITMYENRCPPFNFECPKANNFGDEIAISRTWWMGATSLFPPAQPLFLLFKILCCINTQISKDLSCLDMAQKIYSRRKDDKNCNTINDMIFLGSLIDERIMQDMFYTFSHDFPSNNDNANRLHPLYASDISRNKGLAFDHELSV